MFEAGVLMRYVCGMSRPYGPVSVLRLGVALLLTAIFGGQACAQPAGRQSFIVVRDAETETLLRNIANPLFRAAGVDPGLVRITLLRDDAINSFVSTGNRMFINTGLISGANSVGELIGVIAHETGHIRSGHLARLPEAMQEAMLETIAATLFGAAAVLGSSQTRTRSPYRDNSIGDAGIGANAIGMWPPSRSVSAGPVPL